LRFGVAKTKEQVGGSLFKLQSSTKWKARRADGNG